jgi:hypothetical protein
LTASGDTVFPLVHVPSERPDSAAIAVRGEQMRRNGGYLALILAGVIPTSLILLTLAWWIARQRDVGAP